MGYNKKVLSEATANLNKRKAPVQKKDIIVDPRGQWAHPGQPTRIPGNNITMQGVPYPVYGIDNTGFAQMMYPGQDYQFQGDYVDEYPMARKGGSMPKIPKKKDSKGYSRSITATNRLFAQNPLTKKTKSKKRKVFDPNAKYYQDGGDISIPELTKAQEGLSTGQCPPGQKPDGKGGCILIEEKDLEEAVVYGDPAKDKQQTSLMNKFRQVKGAYQDWRENAGLTQRQLRNEGASSIEGLKRQIADYKKELEEEKKAYDKASKALNVLKKNRPDEWKDAKINDVLSGEGIEALRSLYSEGKVSRESFMNFYDSFGKDFDPNVIEGKGRGQAYSAKEAEQEWMENVPEFADNVQDLVKFITGVAATGGLGELLAPAAPLMNPAATATRAASPFMQAAKAAYKAPIQFGRFGSVPGLTPANIATGYWIGSELMNAPEVLTSVREGVKGEKEWSDVATETGEFVAGVATSGFPFVRAAKELKPGAQAVTKLLDRPFSTYTLLNKPFKAVTTNPAYQRFTRFAGSKYPKFLGQIRNLETMTPADLLKFQTVESTLSNLPGTIENIGSDVNTALDSNLSPAERLLAAGSAGRSTLMSTLGVLPIFRKTAPLYSTNFANRAFLVDNLIKSGIEDDVQGARAIFNASRLLSKQEGGATDTYIDELPQKKIDQLIKQGYKIEYLD